ncbi:hypothetical protein LUZ62_063907 [Rhynchospora pubera]|uniref:SHSP domain-containing protein n=1 Tax=Rhynchospora pubera TaxID=906938 RepID=A0AAV8EHH8_9POAL|nr:hypothetical protein LUZ62_063907 [Rhynchospora pubera]
MSIIRSNIFDPFSLDLWDPFVGFPFNNTNRSLATFDNETSSFVNARIDWKETAEAHIFKADLPGMRKEEVNVEVEEGKCAQNKWRAQPGEGGEERQVTLC